MRSPLFSLQAAIYDRLTAKISDAAVYDFVPEDTKFPYIAIGEDTALPWNSKTADGQEVTHTLHLFSQAPGSQEIKDLIDQAIAALTVAPLDLSEAGFTVAVHSLDFNQTLKEGDGITRHGILRFRFKIQEIPEVE